MSEHLDYVHGVNAFLTAFPGASTQAVRQGFQGIGVEDNSVLMFSELMDSWSRFLTANADTVYCLSFVDLSDGPMVVETPPMALGTFDDMWSQWIIDFGMPGPDRGAGGKFLLVPPSYHGPLPEGGFYVARSRTNRALMLCRSFLEDGDPAPTVATIKSTLKIYPYSPGGSGTSVGTLLQGEVPFAPASTDVPATTFVEGTGTAFNTIPPTDARFFETVHALLQDEPADAGNPEIVGHLAELGIVKGKPFAPDERMRGILEEAATVGNAISRALMFDARGEEDVYFYPRFGVDQHAVRGRLPVRDADPAGHPRGDQAEPAHRGPQARPAHPVLLRLHRHHPGDGDAPHRDRLPVPRRLHGPNRPSWTSSRSYTVTLPPDVPQARFWSLTLYDNQTRSMLVTPQRYPRAGSQSYPTPTRSPNAGRVDHHPRRPGTARRRPRRQLDPDGPRQGVLRHPPPVQPTATVLRQVLARRRVRTRPLTPDHRRRNVMSPDRHARTMLPIPDRPAPGLTTYDAKDPDTAFPPIEPLLPPAVLRTCWSSWSTTSASARRARSGVRATRRPPNGWPPEGCGTTGSTPRRCVRRPRQALLTGRNHHSVGMGRITETATSAPGNNSLRPNTKAPLAETLKLNGYSTAQFGKCHEVPVWQSSPMGPFDAWPSGGGGFEYFYGFIGGENNQWDPALYNGTTPVEPPATAEEGYHLTEDLADQAIGWVRQQKALMPDKPFFVYFAPGATHAPHHVPKEWADQYAGQFDDGWDVQRERTFARQKELGVIPADAELTVRHDVIPAWDDMPDELKPVLAREMEVYAGFLEHTDHHVGRLIDAIEDLGILDDTIIYYIIGDNGASAEGTLNGAFNEMANFNGMAALETPEFMISKMDEFGSPSSYNHYAVGWAWAMDTPFQWTKQVASHWGGTRNGTIVHWPNGIEEKGGLRSQFTHVIDVAPTILEAAGLPEPTMVNGVQQSPIEGTSMLYTFNDADGAGASRPAVLRDVRQPRHLPQGVERGDQAQDAVGDGRRRDAGVRRRRVGAVRRQRRLQPGPRPRRRAARDAGQAAAAVADRGGQVQRRADGRPLRRAGQPGARRTADPHPGQLAAVLRRHGPAVGEQRREHQEQVVLRHRRSRRPRRRRQGVIIAQGGRFGGWAVYFKDGRAKFVYNTLGIHEYPTTADTPIPAGKHQVRMEFAYDGGGLAKGGDVTLYYDGGPVGPAGSSTPTR